MLLAVPPAHTNILLATATQCCSAMVAFAIAGMAVTYIWSTGEHVPSTIIGRSTHGDDLFCVKYMRNGHQIEHHAPLDHVLFSICSPSLVPSEASPTQGWYCRSRASRGLSKHGTS